MAAIKKPSPANNEIKLNQNDVKFAGKSNPFGNLWITISCNIDSPALSDGDDDDNDENAVIINTFLF